MFTRTASLLPPSPSTLLAATALLLAAAPGVAHATTTISRSGNTITMTGDAAGDSVFGAGDHSDRFVTFFGHTDDTLRAGAGCHFQARRDSGGHKLLLCGKVAREANPLTLNANLGAGDDDLALAWRSDRQPRAVVDAGDGNDHVTGTLLSDDLKGGAGDDQLNGLEDNDLVDGGEGNDQVYGGEDSDFVRGGPGIDQIYGDAVDTAPDPFDGYASGDIIDATDFPVDVTGLTPEQVLAYSPQPDQVFCGPGVDDAATVDAFDTVAASCEQRAGANPTPPVDHSDHLPFLQLVSPRERYSLTQLLRGEPLRFDFGASTGDLVDANVAVSARDARRFHLPGHGADARLIASMRPVLVQSGQRVNMIMRVDWSDRAHLRDHAPIQAVITVRSHIQGAAAGPTPVVTTRTITLAR